MKMWRTLTFEGETQKFGTEEEAQAAGETIAAETKHMVYVEHFEGGKWFVYGTAGEKEWPDWEAPQDVVLGDWVRTTPYGHVGRVHRVHAGYPAGFGCPEDEAWLQGQEHPVMAYKNGRWVSILCHGGGSVSFPDALVERLTDHPEKLDNRYANQYFRTEES